METTLATLQSADVENAIPSKKNHFYATAWYKHSEAPLASVESSGTLCYTIGVTVLKF